MSSRKAAGRLHRAHVDAQQKGVHEGIHEPAGLSVSVFVQRTLVSSCFTHLNLSSSRLRSTAHASAGSVMTTACSKQGSGLACARWAAAAHGTHVEQPHSDFVDRAILVRPLFKQPVAGASLSSARLSKSSAQLSPAQPNAAKLSSNAQVSGLACALSSS